jgi:uncharacterized protein (DUF2384 family)
MTPFETWEDFTAGMYRPRLDRAQVWLSRALLRDQEAFIQAATEMLREWPIAAMQNIHHMWSGRNAWVGQATCCYSVGSTSAETRAAWGDLVNAEQRAANEAARLVRAAWEKGQRDAQTSFAL